MKKLFLIFLLLASNSYADTLLIPTTYSPSGQVTSANLNGNFSAVATKFNGKIDNTNVDTTNGFRLYETLATLPTTSLSQGRAVFLTSDNSFNIYSGSAWLKQIAGGATTGSTAYYNSASTLAENTVLTYNTTSTNIGIGSVNPRQKLEVAGTVRATAFTGGTLIGNVTGDVTGNLTGTASQVTFADSASDTTTWVGLGRQQTGGDSVATDAGLTYNSSSNVLSITGNLNVGIGTTVAQQLCRKADGTFGYFNGAWASVCN